MHDFLRATVHAWQTPGKTQQLPALPYLVGNAWNA